MRRKRKALPAAHELREISVRAVCSPPTVKRYFLGLPVRGTSRLRIQRALDAMGFRDPEAARAGR